MKRFLVLGVLGLFLVSMMGGVLGQEDYSEDIIGAADTFATTVGGVSEKLLGPLFGDTELLSRTFFALLLGMIIYSVISVMFKKSTRPIKWGITGLITALSLLGLPASFLEALRTQYGAMGATILTIIPFLIILIFSLKVENKLFARITWLFYAGYYLAMYAYGISQHGGLFTTESIPYLGGFIVGLFLFFGMGAIRNLLFKGEVEGLMEGGMKKVEKRKAARTISDANLTAETGVNIEQS